MKTRRSAANILAFEALTATAAELNVLHSSSLTAAEAAAHHGLATTVTVTAVAGASNVSTVTVTVKNADGATVAAVHNLELWTASDSAGTTISATAYSGSLVAGTGKILTTLTAKHHFNITTDANGVFIGSLTDTSKTADYIAVRKPLGGGVVVSSAAAYG